MLFVRLKRILNYIFNNTPRVYFLQYYFNVRKKSLKKRKAKSLPFLTNWIKSVAEIIKLEWLT